MKIPILLAPMAGAYPPSLSIAIANARGLGACGTLLMEPEAIKAWSAEFRRQSRGEFQLNLWIPEPPPVRDLELEKQQRDYLATWEPPVPTRAGDAVLPNFEAQCQAMLAAKPKAISSIMGLYAADFIAGLKARGILWFATGGIADARGVAAALILGASAVQIGTGFLRSPEAMIHPAYADRLAQTEAHQTLVTRAFTGRPGRSVATAYVRASAARGVPPPASYPVQRGLTRAMREDGQKAGDAERIQMWAGQSARLARAEPAGSIALQLWEDASRLLL
jgi:nitronate monooxygenase